MTRLAPMLALTALLAVGCGRAADKAPLPLHARGLFFGYYRDAMHFRGSLPAEQKVPRADLVEGKVRVTWQAAIYEDCGVPEAFVPRVEHGRLHLAIRELNPCECVDINRCECACSDDAFVSDLWTELTLRSGEHEISVSYEVDSPLWSDEYNGEPQILTVVVP